MKKAYLVTIEVRTRVVVDVTNLNTPEEIEDVAITQAVGKILRNPDGYLLNENCTEVAEDNECPVGTFDDD